MSLLAADPALGRPARSRHSRLQRGHLVGELDRRGGRSPGCLGERADPLGDASLAERREPLDVGGGAGRQDDADRRDEAGGDAAAPQHDVHEGAADAAVAVDERVDGLELGVGDGRLRHRGQVVAGDEGDEVLEQRPDEVLGRRHEGGVGRVAEPAADPVLLLAHAAGPRPLVARHEHRVDRQQVGDGHRLGSVPDRDRLLHRGHVRRDDPGAAPRGPRVDERSGEVERGDVVALDPGRRHGLRPQEQRADRLEAAHRGALVERPDRRLGIRRQVGDLERDDGAERRDLVRDECLVPERGTCPAPAHRARVSVPRPLDGPRHTASGYNPSISRHE